MKRVLTYGTFDLLHYGHIRLLKRAKAMGDYLVVALSTDEFNEIKGKTAYHNYEKRKIMLEAIRYVDLVIPEYSWDQKPDDVRKYHIDTVVMGSDWAGSEKFHVLKDACELVFLDRTKGISTSQIKQDLGLADPINGVDQIPEVKGKV
ncbi:MAG: glycerol-3-phosphate cytidylyltransferase [Clostridiales bacterium]|nr:glycerol-3-phosphate cytidylyltransferase [Clostridiales bacterium]